MDGFEIRRSQGPHLRRRRSPDGTSDHSRDGQGVCARAGPHQRYLREAERPVAVGGRSSHARADAVMLRSLILVRLVSSSRGELSLPEVFDQHDIAFNLVHTSEEDPLPIWRDIEAPRTWDRVSQIQGRNCLYAFGREIQEPNPSRHGRPVDEVDTVRSNLPPGKHRLALEDARGLLARGPHPPNSPALHPHVEELAIGRFLCAERTGFRDRHRTATQRWDLPNLP